MTVHYDRIDHKSNTIGLAQSMLGHKWSVELDGGDIEGYLDRYMNDEIMGLSIDSVGGKIRVGYKIISIEKVERELVHFSIATGREQKIKPSSHRISFEIVNTVEPVKP
jgi:hypothetical protein